MRPELLVAHHAGDPEGLLRIGARLARRSGFHVTHVELGDEGTHPAVEIARRAGDPATLLVIAPLALDDGVRWGVLRRSRTPVLWLPHTPEIPTRVVAALDGRSWSRYVLDAARHVAALLDADLGATTVSPTDDDPRLSSVLGIIASLTDLVVPLHVTIGTDAASALRADEPDTLLAVGVHRGGAEGATVGDQTARKVLARAKGPVLSVPL